MKKQNQQSEGMYAMRVVTRLTGLTPDVIRVWERRYGAVEPSRSDGNTRLYSAAEVRRLSLLREVTARGHRIKNVAHHTEDQLRRLLGEADDAPANINQTAPNPDTRRQAVDEYLEAIRRFEAGRAMQLLARAALFLAPHEFVFQIVVPILQRTGHLWIDGRLSVAHEHLVSSHIRGLLFKMLDLASPQSGAPKILVTTPENHLHEFGALVGGLLAASRGFDLIYLGPNLPDRDIRLALDLSRADVLLLSISRDMEASELADFHRALADYAGRVETWVGLPPEHTARGGADGVKYLTTFEDLDLALTRFDS